MFPNTRRAAAVTAGVLAAVGGVLLAAGGGEPPMPREPDRLAVHRPAPVPASPEPAWMTAFRRRYELKDGEYVKRVGPPYIEERKEYVYRVWYPEMQPPEHERWAREHLGRRKLFLLLFLDSDGTRLTTRTRLSANAVAEVPQFQDGEKVINVWDAVALVTGRESPEVVIDPKSIDHPLLSTKDVMIDYRTKEGGRPHTRVRGTPSVAGDFVTRKNAPLAKLAPQLETILRAECELDVRLAVREVEQEVYVAGGAFELSPRAWRKEDEVDLYADEGVLAKHFNRTNTDRPEEDGIRSGWQIVTPATLARDVGEFVNVRMVCDRELPTRPRFHVYRHERSPDTATAEQKAADHNPEKVLANLSAQTGLTFKKARRRVEVLYLSAPGQK